MKQRHVPAPEFSRPLPVDRVPRKGTHEHIKAEPEECAALAKRFGLPQLHALSARFLAAPWRGGGLKVTGTVEADLEQVSVISLQPFRHRAKFEVERFFLPPKDAGATTEEDADPIVNGEVDLGVIAAETLGLELDPYPRMPGESFTPPDSAA
ncbi:MAG: DUF177 domain-containing protein [Alphaproteobacteria bacterium]|nr:DUF177 domain-containing protein [Alphaproteobacteria bacterium]